VLSYADFATVVLGFVDLLKKAGRVFHALAIAQGVSIEDRIIFTLSVCYQSCFGTTRLGGIGWIDWVKTID